MVMKYCGPVHASQQTPRRSNKATPSTDDLNKEPPTRHRRHSTRSISPPKSTMPPSSRSLSRRSRSSRRDKYRDDVDGGRVRSKSSYQRDRSRAPASSRGKSVSRFSLQHKFSDPSRPFDVNGYCVIHKDVLMAKLKCDEWKMLCNECPKCNKMHGSNRSGSMTDKTESSTQGESFDSPPQSNSRRMSIRSSYRDEQLEVKRIGNNFDSTVEPRDIGSRRRSVRPSYRDEQREVQRSGKRFVDEYRQAGARRKLTRPSYRDEQQEVRSSRRNPSIVRRSANSIQRSQRSLSKQFDDSEEEEGSFQEEEKTSYDSRSRHSRRRGEHREREDRARSKSRARSRSRSSFSRVSRSSCGGRNDRSKHMSRPKPKIVCVNGVPFDKNGCCFLHPHVKLASKKLLGGWKVHHTFCRACAVESQCDDDGSAFTSRSGYSSRSGHTSSHSRRASHHSDYSDAMSAAESVVASVRSLRSNISAASWTSNQSRKKVKKEESFLPLDKDGYCTHHPDVQLAKLGKRGEWRVLIDFCPECAEASLMIGGAPGSKSSKSKSRRRNCDESSVKSSKSNESDRTFVKKMPFIDSDGKPGHYTGYLNIECRPDGRGKMKYLDGKTFDGLWKGGNQLEGKVWYKKSKNKSTSGEEKNK